jgi:hypothetical protein
MWDELRTGTPPRCRLAITTGFTAVTPPPASLMSWEVMSNRHHPVMYVIVGLRSYGRSAAQHGARTLSHKTHARTAEPISVASWNRVGLSNACACEGRDVGQFVFGTVFCCVLILKKRGLPLSDLSSVFLFFRQQRGGGGVLDHLQPVQNSKPAEARQAAHREEMIWREKPFSVKTPPKKVVDNVVILVNSFTVYKSKRNGNPSERGYVN